MHSLVYSKCKKTQVLSLFCSFVFFLIKIQKRNYDDNVNSNAANSNGSAFEWFGFRLSSKSHWTGHVRFLSVRFYPKTSFDLFSFLLHLSVHVTNQGHGMDSMFSDNYNSKQQKTRIIQKFSFELFRFDFITWNSKTLDTTSQYETFIWID